MPLPLHLHTAQERRAASTVPPPSQSHHVIAPSRLRNLFTPNKSATFAVTVTIHSIQNVPQVQGSFSVGWKFRDAERRGKAKVDVKGPLPFPHEKKQERHSLDDADSHVNSAASSTHTVDDP
ncbi:hypothetical protein QFC20_005173 [Naganishia adeliensis]|uniref:Uncharacterized protein n=1 Tax=Naganishia adeliensis TaxID=92952 RepID=A0ACC2VT70_9TREE|nr:hypothetical protein QFC20_005173 [Naganishia adeliensis]